MQELAFFLRTGTRGRSPLYPVRPGLRVAAPSSWPPALAAGRCIRVPPGERAAARRVLLPLKPVKPATGSVLGFSKTFYAPKWPLEQPIGPSEANNRALRGTWRPWRVCVYNQV
jgi:hypothetical protein